MDPMGARAPGLTGLGSSSPRETPPHPRSRIQDPTPAGSAGQSQENPAFPLERLGAGKIKGERTPRCGDEKVGYSFRGMAQGRKAGVALG